MKTKDFAAIAIAIVVAGAAGLTIYSDKGTDDYCPPPSAASVATLFAPCQAFDTALGHSITKKQAVQMGLLRPDEQATQSATRVAEGSAASEWLNPKAASASIQMMVRRPMGFI